MPIIKLLFNNYTSSERTCLLIVKLKKLNKKHFDIMEDQLPSEYIHKWSDTGEKAQRRISKYENLAQIAKE